MGKSLGGVTEIMPWRVCINGHCHTGPAALQGHRVTVVRGSGDVPVEWGSGSGPGPGLLTPDSAWPLLLHLPPTTAGVT